jgi:hypothetical protein
VTCFLPPDSYRDPVDGRKAKGHGETDKRYQVQIDGSQVSCHDEIVSVPSKKQGTIRQLAEWARQPKDAVPGDETVRVLQYFINGTEVNLIDVGVGYKAVLGWRKAIN